MISVLGIPWDANSSYLTGPALAPPKIREAFHSDSGNYFSELGVDLKNNSQWKDVGDLTFGSDHFADTIKRSVSALVKEGKVFSLGGDHSISFPVIEAVSQYHKDLTILHIDAHGDLYDNFDNNPYSHASPFARIMEKGLARRLVQVGIRTYTTHQREQAMRFGVEAIEMKDWSDSHRFEFNGPVYLSLDIDAIDPAFAPGVSHHEPGGFTSRQVISILQNLKCNLVGADLVELNPTRDASGITSMLAGKLFKEILSSLIVDR